GQLLDRSRAAAGGLRRERLRAHEEDVRLVAGELRVDVRRAAEDLLEAGDRAVPLDEVDHVGDDGGVDLHRQPGGHVAAVVAGREQQRVRAVAGLDGRGDGGGNGGAEQLALGAGDGEHLGGAVAADLLGDVTAGRGHDLDGVGERTCLGEELERVVGDLAVGGLGEHPDLGDSHVSFLRSRGCRTQMIFSSARKSTILPWLSPSSSMIVPAWRSSAAETSMISWRAPAQPTVPASMPRSARVTSSTGLDLAAMIPLNDG